MIHGKIRYMKDRVVIVRIGVLGVKGDVKDRGVVQVAWGSFTDMIRKSVQRGLKLSENSLNL